MCWYHLRDDSRLILRWHAFEEMVFGPKRARSLSRGMIQADETAGLESFWSTKKATGRYESTLFITRG